MLQIPGEFYNLSNEVLTFIIPPSRHNDHDGSVYFKTVGRTVVLDVVLY